METRNLLSQSNQPHRKIDAGKTGWLSFFSQASNCPDITQPADNINLITLRHMSTTVIRYSS